MSLRSRKLLVLLVLTSVMLLANVHAVACWLGRMGLVGFAQDLRAEYITGTAIAVILVLLFLLSGDVLAGIARRCPVCDHTMFRGGKYCAACGSRVV